MPELTVIKQDLEMNPRQKDVYVQMRDQFFVWLDENQEEALTATAIIAQLTRLRQIVVWPVFEQIRKDQYGFETKIPINVPDSSKVDEAMDIIEEANDQVVVFCNFNNVFDEIERRCTEMGLVCKKITGATKKDMHQYEIGFQNGEIDVLCINSSMGEGLNLQKNPNQWEGGAAFAIHLDMWWNPARDEQCDARIYRQGANQPVTIYRLHIPNSIDDFVRALSDQKAETFMGIMNDDRIRPGKEWKSVLERML